MKRLLTFENFVPKKLIDQSRTDIIITIADAYLSDIKAIAAKLQHTGLNVTSILYPLGIIAGNATKATINKLQTCKEISAITDDKQITIAPPNAAIQ